MPTPRRHILKPNQRRAIVLLAGCGAEGGTKAMLRANGFATAEIVELVRAGLASATTERVVAGHPMEIAIVTRMLGVGRLWSNASDAKSSP